ncbi:Phenazine biosynthesis protein PhzF like [Alloactinosynnema sp. L-07]|uniref:PhzF family phenazine biosynthesis protein n=1 Tax=Alloactinosynnema sp. L-07 TaxID=1653480 RepID=UPI00065EFEBE|nr:PhzF family phenazine biosynthesis isomerase [Alloactinosynnema sp. L-07]CRK59695.1 Phenazine biosynthesis protein PhzF like [Alloactinosynnema sp. L-07]
MQILRYTAFSTDPTGGNPAGVVLDATGADDAAMLAAAADLGYSETAFLIPRGPGEVDVRYFSPLAEVPFCGHATIAAAVAYARANGVGPVRFHTSVGPVEVTTVDDGEITATLVSVPPKSAEMTDLDALLSALRWSPDDLDPALPPRVAYAGAWHPIVAVRSRERLADLDYDFDALSALMAAHSWTTVDLVWRESASVFWARNPFPPGGVVEDPATGAAAAAFGGYLRELGLVEVPATLTVHQGDDLGRPGVITVGIPADPEAGISVSGTAIAMSDPSDSAE